MLVESAMLASGVESLREGLRTFEHSTREMEGIYESFERRLGHLERDMLPMKDTSNKLNVARRNITKAVEKMEEVNEYFLLEAEVKATVLAGIRGAPSAEHYVDEVRRVVEAARYFKAWPGLRSQQDALKGLSALNDAATKECLDEFNRLMRTIGPTIVLPPAGAFANRTECEIVDPLSASAAAGTFGAIAACLALLDQGTALRQGYSNARGLCVRSALASWEERYEAPVSATEPRGSGAWLRRYLDFVVVAVAGERALWERILAAAAEEAGASSTGSSTGKETTSEMLEMESTFLTVVAPLLDKLVREVDRAVSRAQTEARENQERIGGGAARHRAGAKSGTGGFLGTISTKGVEKAVSTAATAAAGIDGSGAGKAREAEVLADTVAALLEVADAFKRRAGTLAEALQVVRRPNSGVARSGGGGGRDNRAVVTLRGLESRLEAACVQSCQDLVEGVRGDGRRNVPDNASVHVLSSGTLRAIKRTMRFRHGYEALTAGAKLPWDRDAGGGHTGGQSPPRAPDNLGGAEDCEEARRLPRFTALVNELMRALIDNLVEKSKAYGSGNAYPGGSGSRAGGDARRHLFLLNNANYLYANCRRPIGDGGGAGMPSTGGPNVGRGSITSAIGGSAHGSTRTTGRGGIPTPKSGIAARGGPSGAGGAGGGSALRGQSPSPSQAPSPGSTPPPQRSGGTPLAMGGNSFFRMSPRGAGAGGVSSGFNSGGSGHGGGGGGFFSSGGGGDGAGDAALAVDPNTAALAPSDFLTAQTLWLLQRMVAEKVGAYADLLFEPLCRAVVDDVGQLEYQRGGRLLTLECGRLLKAKFTAFNDGWEEVHAGQKGACVSDPALRQRLRDEAKGRVAADYRRLFEKYADVQFSKKHQSQYLRFPPDSVERGIEELFSG